MRTFSVTESPPFLDEHLSLPEALEYFPIEAFISKLAIEGLTVAILPGRSEFNIKVPCATPCQPSAQVVISTQSDEIENACSVLRGLIEALEATTPTGLRAKVRAIACIQSEGKIGFDDVTDERLACEVLNVILGNPALLAV